MDEGEEMFSRDKPKTVGELIEDLRKFDPRMRVMVRGYEGCLHDCDSPEICGARLNKKSDEQWFFGPHELLYDEEKRGEDFIDAVLIGRYCGED